MRKPSRVDKAVRRIYPFALAGIVLIASCARPQLLAPPGPEAPAKGKVRGTIIAEGITVSLEGAVVRLGDRSTTLSPEGRFSFGESQQGKQHLVIEKTFPSGAVRRVLGIATLRVGEESLDVKVPVRDATDVDSFCVPCHPRMDNVTRKDQVYRDAHPSGILARKATGDPELMDRRGWVTCESCHTVHLAGAYPKFGVGEIKSGSFCKRCHSSRKR